MLISRLLAIVSKPLSFNRELLIQYKLGLNCAYYQSVEWLQALTRYPLKS